MRVLLAGMTVDVLAVRQDGIGASEDGEPASVFVFPKDDEEYELPTGDVLVHGLRRPEPATDAASTASGILALVGTLPKVAATRTKGSDPTWRRRQKRRKVGDHG